MTTIRTPPQTVDDAHDFVKRVWDQHPDVSASDRMAVELIVSELVTNSVQNNPRRELLCDVSIDIGETQIVLTTSDTGVPPPLDLSLTEPMPGAHDESGRGLALIHQVAETLTYDYLNNRNLWRVVRSRTNEADWRSVPK